jgi:hypothetical protein
MAISRHGKARRQGRRASAGFIQDGLVSTVSAAAGIPTAASTFAREVSLHERFGFVDGQLSTVELRSAQLRNGFGGIVVAHRDKTETFRAARLAIRDDAGGLYGANLIEEAGEIIFCRVERQISYENFHLIYLT